MAQKVLVSLITGGVQGLGRGFAESILKRGGRVSLIDFDSVQGTKTESELRAKFGQDKVLFIQTDVTNSHDLKTAFSETINKYGKLNLVVNNAGIGTIDKKLWKKTIDINLIALIDGCNLAVENMMDGGHIINVASAAGLWPSAFDPFYTASKYGVVGYSQSLALIRRKREVRVNCLCPEIAETKLAIDMLSYNQIFAKMFAIKPILSISDVVKAFDELVDSEDKNGEVLHISSDKGILRAHQEPPQRVEKSKI